MTATTTARLSPELQKIVEARHHDPFSILGKHQVDGKDTQPYKVSLHLSLQRL